MIIKSVAFNERDPDQKKMLDHANQRTNFSAYVKRLIQRDMDNERAVPIKEPLNVNLMKGLI